MSRVLADPLLETVIAGLSARRKTLPPTLFYDEVGSVLFERITELAEYYLTRAEAEVLRTHGPSIAALVAEDADQVVVIEPGCGSCAKVGALLEHLPAAAYVGLDVSGEALRAGVARLAERFPSVRTIALESDYHAGFPLPPLPAGRRVAFFPGSTIGNFDPDDAVRFLARLGALVGSGGRLVVGVDLWKNVEVLRAAYDDREGVTSAFDKNALVHLNSRYDADFDLTAFDHVARVNRVHRRVEMHLVARRAHVFHVAGERFHIAVGESIHTENAYKYEPADFAALAGRARLDTLRVWSDDARRFGVFALAPSP